ncbi:MAG: 5,6-dimethylbenzimidazole synthase [Halocynthiibacter sp.]
MGTASENNDAGAFSERFRSDFETLLKLRRDVRHFKSDPIPETVMDALLDTFHYAPSVGLSEPWRIVHIHSDTARQAALTNYKAANAAALETYRDDKAALYAKLKLSGMQDAPVQIAVFCDEATVKGQKLGAMTMPEMRRYSVVAAITQFWLAARAVGLGVGWVSILDPDQLKSDLAIEDSWALVAYLCIGWPEEHATTPELARMGWEDRRTRLISEVR